MRVTKLKPGCSTMVEIQREKVGCFLSTPSLNFPQFPQKELDTHTKLHSDYQAQPWGAFLTETSWGPEMEVALLLPFSIQSGTCPFTSHPPSPYTIHLFLLKHSWFMSTPLNAVTHCRVSSGFPLCPEHWPWRHAVSQKRVRWVRWVDHGFTQCCRQLTPPPCTQ